MRTRRRAADEAMAHTQAILGAEWRVVDNQATHVGCVSWLNGKRGCYHRDLDPVTEHLATHLDYPVWDHPVGVAGPRGSAYIGPTGRAFVVGAYHLGNYNAQALTETCDRFDLEWSVNQWLEWWYPGIALSIVIRPKGMGE